MNVNMGMMDMGNMSFGMMPSLDGVGMSNLSQLGAMNHMSPMGMNMGTGMGMGLAISKSIIEAHGGHMRAIDTADGAEFWFTLPVARKEGS